MASERETAHLCGPKGCHAFDEHEMAGMAHGTAMSEKWRDEKRGLITMDLMVEWIAEGEEASRRRQAIREQNAPHPERGPTDE